MKENKTNPWNAGLLSAFITGAGQCYNREYSKGLALFFSVIFFGILLEAEKITYAMGIFITGGILIYSVYDAFKTAKTSTTPPNKYVLWVVCWSYILGIFALIMFGASANV